MKKIFLLGIVFCLLLGIVGCGNAAKNNTTATPASKTEAPASNANTGVATDNTAKAAKMQVRITAGSHVITAELYDNAAGKALWNKLPLKLHMLNLYGREMCYRFGQGGLPATEVVDTGYKVGDISYWPPAGSLVILYKQNGEVFEQQAIGHTDSDISFFDGMLDTDITFEKAK